eukprot:TRINITY_DN4579_c0_g2_i1.p1 TRINITY_DN4579_c0_g2~~TRINITY_DN4579_c0_g2_i1.p1  ORF type:complete len:115 (+),score=0.07 TRINITY_DN4579_c0_g2_i1:738-1082(+)
MQVTAVIIFMTSTVVPQRREPAFFFFKFSFLLFFSIPLVPFFFPPSPPFFLKIYFLRVHPPERELIERTKESPPPGCKDEEKAALSDFLAPPSPYTFHYLFLGGKGPEGEKKKK